MVIIANRAFLGGSRLYFAFEKRGGPLHGALLTIIYQEVSKGREPKYQPRLKRMRKFQITAYVRGVIASVKTTEQNKFTGSDGGFAGGWSYFGVS